LHFAPTQQGLAPSYVVMTANTGDETRMDPGWMQPVGAAGAPRRPAIVWSCGLVTVLAATILVGATGPDTNSPGSAIGDSAGAVEMADRARIAEPMTLFAPEAGALVEGGTVEVRGSADRPLGTVRAILSVAGRQIAASELELDREGPFSIDVPFIAPPFATSAEITVASAGQLGAPIQRRAVSLRPPADVAIHAFALEEGRFMVRGGTPRRISVLDVEVVGQDGTSLGRAAVTPVPSDGWGGMLVPTALFRAEIDVSPPADEIPVGTPLVVWFRWQDPWTDVRSEASFLLVVPEPRDAAP
jgi:hypothetical protein